MYFHHLTKRKNIQPKEKVTLLRIFLFSLQSHFTRYLLWKTSYLFIVLEHSFVSR